MVLYAILEWYVPPLIDDVKFAFHFNQDVVNHNGNILTGYIDYIVNFWKHENNGRLANYLFPMMTILSPRWLFCLLFGLVCAGTVWFTALLGKASKSSADFGGIIFSWILVSFLLPWRDHVLVSDYALNYVFSGFFSLLFLACLQKAIGGNYSKGWAVTYAIAGGAAGMMHEGFSLPLCIGVAVCLLFNRSLIRNRGFIFCCVGLILGTLVCISTPTLWQRLDSATNSYDLALWKSYMIKSVVIVATGALYMVIAVLKPRMRPMLLSPLMIIVFVGMLGSFAIGWRILIGHRLIWFGNMMALILLVRFAELFGLSTKISVFVSSSCAIALTLFFANTIRVQRDLYLEYQSITKEYYSGADIVFRDIPHRGGLACWGYPTSDIWIDVYHYGFWKEAHDNRPLVVVPTALKNINESSGDNIGLSIKKKDNVLFAKASDLATVFEEAKDLDVFAKYLFVKQPTGVRYCNFTFLPFLNSDGDQYYYIAFTHNFDKTPIEKIEM